MLYCLILADLKKSYLILSKTRITFQDRQQGTLYEPEIWGSNWLEEFWVEQIAIYFPFFLLEMDLLEAKLVKEVASNPVPNLVLVKIL